MSDDQVACWMNAMRKAGLCLADMAIVVAISFGAGVLSNTLRPKTSRVPLFGQEGAIDLVAEGKWLDLAISLEEAKDRWDKHDAVFVDARPAAAYREGHIAYALSVNDENFAKSDNATSGWRSVKRFVDGLAAQKLGREPMVIVYCDGKKCGASRHIATRLEAHKIANLRIFAGGWVEWSKAGYPVSKGGAP